MMPGGVLFRRGSQLRIPEGAVVIFLDDQGQPTKVNPVVPQARTDMWPPWLSDAVDAAVEARKAEADVVAAVALISQAEARGEQGNQDHLSDLLDVELRHSMRAISAAAFAVDAFYAAVQARSPEHPDKARWKKAGTARHKQVYETLRFNLKLKQPGAAEIRTRIKELFRFRDWAVHPNVDWKNFEYRTNLGRGVDWRYCAFCAPHAEAAVAKTLAVFDALVGAMDRGAKELEEAQPYFKDHLDRVFASYEATTLVQVPRLPAKAETSQEVSAYSRMGPSANT